MSDKKYVPGLIMVLTLPEPYWLMLQREMR